MLKSKESKQNVTLNKRKRGLIRKAIEIVNLCSQDVYVALADPRTKTLVEFQSGNRIDRSSFKNFEMFDSKDYEALDNKFITQRQMKKIQERHH